MEHGEGSIVPTRFVTRLDRVRVSAWLTGRDAVAQQQTDPIFYEPARCGWLPCRYRLKPDVLLFARYSILQTAC